MKTVITGSAVLDGRLETGGFRIGIEDGTVCCVERARPDGPYRRCIAFPGLIETHLHLCQTLFRGMAEGRTLMPWLEERIWPLEASHDQDTLAVSVIQSLRELLSAGCTGLLDMGSVQGSEVTLDILRRSGVRAVACNTLMDTGPDWLSRDLQWLREETERVRRMCGGLVGHGLAPRFALSCSDGLWSWIRGETGIRTTHAAESILELDHLSTRAAGGSIRFLDSQGFLGDRTLLAHGIHLGEGEAGLLAGSSTAVVHCPWTNLRLGSGIADVPELAGAGIRVTLGSDGAACNNRLDPPGNARLAMSLAAHSDEPGGLEGGFWLRALTIGAAESLGWTGTGRLAPGYCADLVLLEPDRAESGELEQAEDPLKYLLELHWPSRVRMTMVNGEVLYTQGEYPSLPDPPLELSEARSRVASRASEITGGSV